jgi:hypothetical protein
MQINGHKLSLANIVAALGMVGAIGATWATLSAENASVKNRLQTVEDRQKEDRKETKERLQRIEDRVQNTDKNVQEIRILLERQQRR